jgi:hypothetical protein
LFIDAHQIAVVYLAVAAVASTIFLFCSFWVYHFVDLEHDAIDELAGVDAEDAMEAELVESPRCFERAGRENQGFETVRA